MRQRFQRKAFWIRLGVLSLAWAVFAPESVPTARAAGEPGGAACADQPGVSILVGDEVKVLVVRPKADGKQASEISRQLGTALQKGLESPLRQLGNLTPNATSSARLKASSVTWLDCAVNSHADARALGRKLRADVVLWGQVGCGLTDPSRCAAPLTAGALEARGVPRTDESAKEGAADSDSAPGTEGGSAAKSTTARPDSGWMVLSATAVHPFQLPFANSTERPQTAPSELDDLDLPWMRTDSAETLVYALAGLAAHSGARVGLEDWSSSASFLEQAVAKAPRGHGPIAPLLRQAGSALILAQGPLPKASNPDVQRGVGYLEQVFAVCEKGALRCQASALSQRAWSMDALGDPTKALSTYEQALTLNRRLGNWGMSAVCLNNIGLLTERLESDSQALPLYRDALGLAQKAKDAPLELAVRLNAGRSLLRMRQNSDALDYGQKAEALASRLDRPREQTRALHLQASAQKNLGRFEAAIAAVDKALPLVQQTHDTELEVYLLSLKGESLLKLKRKDEALETLQQAAPMARQLGLPTLQATLLSQLGQLHLDRGEKQLALERFLEAIPFIERRNDAAWEASTLQTIGQLYEDTRQPDLALKYAEKSLAQVRKTGDLSWLLARLHTVGKYYAARGQTPEAMSYFEQAVALLQKDPDAPMAAPLLTDTAKLKLALGNQKQAVELYQQALPYLSRSKDLPWEASVWEQIAQIYSSMDQPTAAIDAYLRALPLIKRIGNTSWERGTLEQISRLYFAQGKDTLGQEFAQRAEAIVP